MSPELITVIGFVVLIIGGIAAVASQTSSGPDLGTGLRKLGDPAGRTEQEFVAALGTAPSSISAMAWGQRLLQWQTSHQHLAVLFGPDYRFLQITHRHQV